jgi:hypothetical protein
MYPDAASMTLGHVTVGDNAVGNDPLLYLGGTTTGNSIANVTSPNTWSRIFKQGTGTWTLGNVGIGGFNLQAGTLVINGNYTPTHMAYQTFTGGTLAGTGTLNSAITVPVSGTLAPGNPTGTLTVTNNNCTINGTLRIEIDGGQSPACGALVVSGNLNISAATLSVNVGAVPADSPLVIATYGTLTGTFAVTNGLPDGGSIYYGLNSNHAIAILIPSGTVFRFR